MIGKNEGLGHSGEMGCTWALKASKNLSGAQTSIFREIPTHIIAVRNRRRAN